MPGTQGEHAVSFEGKHVAFVDLDNMAGALDVIMNQFDIIYAYVGACYNGPLPKTSPFGSPAWSHPAPRRVRGSCACCHLHLHFLILIPYAT